jgi:hypothetical protein
MLFFWRHTTAYTYSHFQLNANLLECKSWNLVEIVRSMAEHLPQHAFHNSYQTTRCYSPEHNILHTLPWKRKASLDRPFGIVRYNILGGKWQPFDPRYWPSSHSVMTVDGKAYLRCSQLTNYLLHVAYTLAAFRALMTKAYSSPPYCSSVFVWFYGLPPSNVPELHKCLWRL